MLFGNQNSFSYVFASTLLYQSEFMHFASLVFELQQILNFRLHFADIHYHWIRIKVLVKRDWLNPILSSKANQTRQNEMYLIYSVLIFLSRCSTCHCCIECNVKRLCLWFTPFCTKCNVNLYNCVHSARSLNPLLY